MSAPFPGNCRALRQRGLVLVMLAFLVGLAAAACLVHAMSSANLQMQRDSRTARALAAAKTALIHWAVNYPDQPGLLPYPDRNGDGNYDGDSDCYAANVNFNYAFLLGRLPLFGSADSNCLAAARAGLGMDLRDGDGEWLWYSVSKNLVMDYGNASNPAQNYPAVNPGIIDHPAYPWLAVRDKQGKLVSDRVAAVIIAAGPPLAGQHRAGSAAAKEYLDTVAMSAGAAYRNYAYPLADTDVQNFILGEHLRGVRGDDPAYRRPYLFNDRLAYITIDELMAEVVKRAAGAARSVLAAYRGRTGRFPDAALLGAGDYSAIAGNDRGMLPVDAADSCGCSSESNCTCSFDRIGSVSFRRSGSSTWSAADITGACTRPTSQTCTCNGAGYCRNATGSRSFTCDAAGNCITDATGAYTYQPPPHGRITAASGGCSAANGTAVCSGSGSFSIGLNVPLWFGTNRWQDYFYYHRSDAADLRAGARANVEALLVGAGSPIGTMPYAAKEAAQSRPSPDIGDYLDSAENTDGDLAYDAVNSARNRSYNDQVFIVAR